MFPTPPAPGVDNVTIAFASNPVTVSKRTTVSFIEITF